jgi:DoxX-like family
VSLLAAAPKLGIAPHIVASFADLGVSATGMHTIGVLEIAGAAGLLIPRLAGLSAAALVALMTGAVGLTVAHRSVAEAVVPAVFLAVVAAVAWGRRGNVAPLARDLSRVLHLGR